MTIESILISDDNTNLTTMAVQSTEDERKVQETVDFKMVTFSLSGKDYAIDIMYVKEIAKAGQFTYVPNTLPFVVGVYNLRGEIIPILDMRIFFNIDAKDTAKNGLQNLLILNVEEQTFGIIVDKIDKVVGIQKSTIQPPHPLFVDINIKYISGVVESNKHLYILLDIARIFSKAKDEDELQYEKRLAEVSSNYDAQRAAAKTEPAAEKSAPAAAAPAPAKTETAVPEPAQNKETEQPAAEKSAPVKAAAEASAAPVQEVKLEVPPEPEFDEKNYGFVCEGLKTFAKFTVSAVNESWTKHRFDEWSKERTGNSVQIQSDSDAAEFLKSFWSGNSGKWWTKEYADTLSKLLPENSAKQIVVWNPGCGNGIETYCLACVLAARYPDSKIRLYAQDIDLLSVSNAPMLTVPEDGNTAWLKPYLTKTASGGNAFNQQIKDSIMFEYHDCQHTNALPMVDLIFARDLLSLLEENSQKAVLADFLEKLKGNGSVVLGENETVPESSDFLEHTEGSITVYAKQ